MPKLKETVVLLLVVLLVLPVVFAASAKANYATVSIDSPTPNSIVKSENTTVRFTVDNVSQNRDSVSISANATVFFDGQFCGAVPISFGQKSSGGGELSLTGLFQGQHTVQVNVTISTTAASGGANLRQTGTETYLVSSMVNFTVYLGIPPEVSIASLDEYATSQPAVNITTDVPVSMVCYCVDEGENVSLPYQCCCQYNLNLTGLAGGIHTLTAYAVDPFGNVGVAQNNFTVNAQTQNSQPTPIYSTIALIAGAGLAGLFLASVLILAFFRMTSPQEIAEPKPTEEQASNSSEKTAAEPEKKTNFVLS
jgi:hypothetical protein